MVDIFHKHIQKSIANENLQIALDANADRRITAREQALNSMHEDWNILRQRARKVRLQTINHLDEYLDQFINQAIANGMIVHKAADAGEAVQIVVDIANEKNAKLIAKSKTMVSEEIGLNHSLEAAGLRVIETDLGEFIVQLRGEPPAHIITPAVHLRKEEVGATFEKKAGYSLHRGYSNHDCSRSRAIAKKFFRGRYWLIWSEFWCRGERDDMPGDE